MSKKEQYGLVFYKQNVDGLGIRERINIKPDYEKNNILYYIARWGKSETKAFIYDLKKSLEMQSNYEEDFFTDSTEMLEVLFVYPNITIRDESDKNNYVFTIPMADMKELLEEWLAFIS